MQLGWKQIKCRHQNYLYFFFLVDIGVDVNGPVQLVDLAVKLIQGAGGTLGVDGQRLGLQPFIDLDQILIDAAQLLFQSVELGLAGDADPYIRVVLRQRVDLTR